MVTIVVDKLNRGLSQTERKIICKELGISDYNLGRTFCGYS